MLALTKKSEYALIAVCHLARVTRHVVSARDIAEEHRVPLPLLMNVLKKLNQAGFVSSVRGARGGYRLAVAPQTLTLAAVIAAVEGPVRLVGCLPAPPGRRQGCARAAICAIRRPVHKVHERLLAFLEKVAIADLAFDGEYAASGREGHGRVGR